MILLEDRVKNLLKIAAFSALVIVLVFSLGVTKSSKSSDRAWLGVLTQSVDRDIADAFDLPVSYGAIINEVLEDSPAEEAGIREDDIIIEMNGRKITDSEELIDLIHDSKPGDEVTIIVQRDESKESLTATLSARPRGHRPDRAYRHYSFRVPRAPRVPRLPRIPKIDHFYLHAEGRGYLGVYLTDLGDQLGEYFGVERGRGALVTEVEEDSPAEEAGIKAGDVIISVDNEKIADSRDVREVVRDLDTGDEVEVVVIRDKKEVKLKAEIGERERGYSNHDFDFDFDFDFDHDYDHDYRMPDLDIRLPQMWGLKLGDFDNWDDYLHDEDEFREELEELMEEMEEIRRDYKGVRGELDKDLRKELEEMRKELKELRKRLD